MTRGDLDLRVVYVRHCCSSLRSLQSRLLKGTLHRNSTTIRKHNSDEDNNTAANQQIMLACSAWKRACCLTSLATSVELGRSRSCFRDPSTLCFVAAWALCTSYSNSHLRAPARGAETLTTHCSLSMYTKARFVDVAAGELKRLAMHVHGSRTLDACYSACDITRKVSGCDSAEQIIPS